MIAFADLLPEGKPVEAPIYLYDSILGRGETGGDCPNFCGHRGEAVVDENGTVPFGGGQFDFVVGNPPWIAWDNLPDEDRQATKPLWERYGLFSLSGNEARHGGGKKDLSMLMLYAAADRYLKPGGRLGMVITQTLFQTKGAGDGFRRFRLGHDGPPLRVLRVDDMVALRPFGDASNWTSTIVLEKGAATEYPVPYFKWEEGRGERGERRGNGENDECGMMNDESAASIHHSSFIIHHSCLARPIDPAKPTSPWLISAADNSRGPTARGFSPFPLGEGTCETGPHPNPLPKGEGTTSQAVLPADYVAHLGANSGGANGVYWVEVLEESGSGVLIRNLAARGKHPIEIVEHVIEPDLLYPLLRWGDVGRYSATPAAHLLLTQDPATRSGIDESVMRTKYPRTLAYLERFHELLARRAAYRRYQQGGPFYAMYNVGPYTVAPIKVVWRRMDRRINAVVVESCGVALKGHSSPSPGQRPGESGAVDVTLSSAQRAKSSPNGWPVGPLDEHDAPRFPGRCPGLGERLGLRPTELLPTGSPPRHFQAGKMPAPQVRPAIPQETCVLVACDSSEEAHYLCAMLNSAAVNELVAAHSVRGGKGFGTPGMFDFLPLRRYRPDDPRHVELAGLSRRAHAASGQVESRPDGAEIAEFQRRMDCLAR